MSGNNRDIPIQEAMRLANSEAGKELLSLLQQTNSAQLQQAMRQASEGNYAALQQTMQTLLSTEQAQALVRKLEGRTHG